MKLPEQHIVILLLAAMFFAFQCESGIRGRVVEVKEDGIVVFIQDSDSVRVGEEFSLWRDRRTPQGMETIRTATIKITRVLAPDTAWAVTTYGKAEVGDKVTKWMITEE